MPNRAAAVLVRRSQIFKSLDLFLVYPNDGIAILRWEQNQMFIINGATIHELERLFNGSDQQNCDIVSIFYASVGLLESFFLPHECSQLKRILHTLNILYIFLAVTVMLFSEVTVVKLREWQVCRFSLLLQCISGPFRQLQTPIHCYMWRKESFTYCNLAVNNPIECSWHVGGSNIKWLLFYIWLYENLWELDEEALISQ